MKRSSYLTAAGRFFFLALACCLAARCGKVAPQPSAPAPGIEDCYARLDGETLKIGNSLIERTFAWHGGNLRTLSLTDFSNGKTFTSSGKADDFGAVVGTVSDGKLSVKEVPSGKIRDAFLQADVTFLAEKDGAKIEICRRFKVAPGVPAIACETYVRGDKSVLDASQVLDQLNFGGKNWKVRAVEFRDVTDRNNNLVFTKDFISGGKAGYPGNLLFVKNLSQDGGFFMLKEAPCSNVQLDYPGQGFIVSGGLFQMTGLGVGAPGEGIPDWTMGYGSVVGVSDGSELSALQALRSYQKSIRRHEYGRDEMIMMNTWGDRSQDSKVGESFCLAELEKASRLGITHFQIDDGWQCGKSPNSKNFKGSFKNIWDNPDYWTPDPGKYPSGLTPVVKKAAELGIELGLWFNPSIQNEFEDWEKDAGAVIKLYKEYGIKVFKIDGVSIPTKKAEANLRRFFSRVLEETGDDVLFNLDVTSGIRGGYHMFCSLGNVFLENRYTDWGNYYPWQTLRNLWMLSRYVPAERLQIEFLNNWRNHDKYIEGDPLAPGAYDFRTLFALTMAGQPLAWMEASNLPEEAYALRPLIDDYRAFAADFHSGCILPVGEEPDGHSWTGFQSLTSSDEGYMIIYRGLSDEAEAYVSTWLPEGSKVRFTPLAGEARAFGATVGASGSVCFSLPSPNTFAAYSYKIR